MIKPDQVVALILAAGLSRRFGARDKLAEPIDGLPLGLHAARTLGALPFAAKIAVTREGGPDFASLGFTEIINRHPDAGQSASLRMGVERARRFDPRAVLVALGDMPYVPLSHFEMLIARFSEAAPVVGSSDGRHVSPPAMFGRALFDDLEALTGDRGARSLLRDALLVPASPDALRDIDTPADLPDAVAPGPGRI